VNTADTADRIPVYVRDGGIVPTLSEDPEVLEIRYYGKKDGSFLLFDDDGESFDYENGAYDSVLISVCRNDSKEATLTSEYIHDGLQAKNYKQFKLADMSKTYY
jgi:alpha-glucosidase (family GH31 glycosyl hydrolase)